MVVIEVSLCFPLMVYFLFLFLNFSVHHLLYLAIILVTIEISHIIWRGSPMIEENLVMIDSLCGL